MPSRQLRRYEELLESIRVCLGIFGTTRGSAAEPVLRQYLDHPDPQVRDDATDALVELRLRRRQRAH